MFTEGVRAFAHGVGRVNRPASDDEPSLVVARASRRGGPSRVRVLRVLAVLALLATAGWSMTSAAVPRVTAAGSCTGWTSSTTPPTSIRVLRTSGGAAGSVQTVPFREYVKTVIAAEWS